MTFSGAERFAEETYSHLKDRLAPFPTEVARAQIESELGKPVEALFSSFGEPVAAASLAQAHEGGVAAGRPAGRR